MSTRIEGKRILNGAYGILIVDGEVIAEVKNVNAEVEIMRDDVQTGIDMDSKMIGLKGTGSLTIYHVYTRNIAKMLSNYGSGHDVRSVLSIINKDPDAHGGQQERVDFGNVWFNKLPLASFARGEKIEKEFEFGFVPTECNIPEGIY